MATPSLVRRSGDRTFVSSTSCPMDRRNTLADVTLLTPYDISPRLEVPASIERPEYVGKPQPAPHTGGDVMSPEIIEKMRVASRLAAQAMREAASIIKPGVTTDEIDRAGHAYLVDHGAYPSTLGYKGFPK